MLEIKMPVIPGTKPNIVGKIDYSVGDKIDKDEVLFTVETSKGNREIKSKEAGIIKELLVEEGQTVKANDVLVIVEEDGGEDKHSDQKEENISEEKVLEVNIGETEVEKDLLVIGAGPGGYVAAIYAAKRGMNVALIEKESLGGTCLNVGCIPTKSLVQTADHYESLGNMKKFGIEIDADYSIDMKKVLERKENVVFTLISGIEFLIKKNKIQLIRGNASFIDDKTVKVNETVIKARNIIIATGSIPAIINVKGNDLDGVMDSTDALNLKKIPDSLTIIGGGVIGLEFAFIYNAFGSDVKLIEYQDGLLPMFDREVAEEIENIATEKGIKVMTSSKVKEISETVEGDLIVSFEKDGKILSTVSNKILMATGRKANTAGLGLENTSVNVDEKSGNIPVNEYKQTNVENIYAIGDVSSNLKLAHVASHEGMIAVDHILGEKRVLDERTIPSVVYTNPEIAIVGYSEEDLKDKKIEYKYSRFDFVANGKALTMEQNRGFVKVLADKDGKILGAAIIGPDASSLISSLTIAIKNNVDVEQLTHTVFAHPTTSEVIHEACLDLIGRGVHQ